MWKECLALSLSELVLKNLGCASAISGNIVGNCGIGSGWGGGFVVILMVVIATLVC